LFDLIQPIETEYADYYDLLKKKEKVDQFVLNTIARNVLLIQQRRAEQLEVKRKQKDIRDYIVFISYDVEEQKNELLMAAERFRTTIENAAGPGCTTKDIVTALACIVAIAAAVAGAVVALIGAVEALAGTIGQRMPAILKQLVQVQKLT
jgi:hypothetical protein